MPTDIGGVGGSKRKKKAAIGKPKRNRKAIKKKRKQ